MTGAEFDGVDIDLLADYVGGALAGTPDEPVVAALIADDPAWRSAYESLGDGMALVEAELGRLEPEPMPADLAARLDAMFRTAPAHLAEPSDSSQAHLTDSSNSAQAPLTDSSNSASAHLAGPSDPAPIADELAAPPAPHLKLVRGDGHAQQPAEKPAAKPAAKRPGRRMRWAAPIAVAAGLFAFAGFSLDYLAGRSADDHAESATNSAADMPADSAAGGAARSQAGEQILASGTDYTQLTLAALPPQPMAAAESESASGKDTSGSVMHRGITVAEPLSRLLARAALDDCFGAIERENGGGAISVQSVDYARFDGTPAVIVRFSDANGQWAWASGAECGAAGGGANTLGKVPVR